MCENSADFGSRKRAMNGLYNLQLQVINCQKCHLHSKVKSPVPGQISFNTDFLFIGLAPGRSGAEVTGIPFTKDKSGRLFRRMTSLIEERGLTFSVTNIVKCNPLDREGRNRNPTNDEVEACTEYLKREIEITKPKVIVILGKVTEKLLGIKEEKENFINAYISVKSNSSPRVLTIYHPSAIANYHKMTVGEYEDVFGELITLYDSTFKEAKNRSDNENRFHSTNQSMLPL